MLNENTILQFTEALASEAPVPGGGSTAGVTAAFSAGLAAMAARLSERSAKTEEKKAQLAAVIEAMDTFREAMLRAAEADAEAFEPLSRVYRLPKEDPGRPALLEEGLRTAAAAPLALAELCVQEAEYLPQLAREGSLLSLSDAGCAASVCCAALESAILNVRANTRLMKDRQYAEGMDAACAELLAAGSEYTKRALATVRERLS